MNQFKKFATALFIFNFQFSIFNCSAQTEHIVPLHGNRQLSTLASARQAFNIKHSTSNIKHSSSTMVSLPFLDDFSKPGPYPDTSKWIDKNVFVNYGSPVCPPTLGVATFDGLDSIGKPYYPGASPYSSSPCDRLTSKPITWANTIDGSYNAGDSVYLSFYYQAGSYFGTDSNGGIHRSTLGYWPKETDTLLLQFRAAGDTLWNTIWYLNGYEPVQDTDTCFHIVMIPFDTGRYIPSLTQLNSYFKDGFQFRFLAYSCGSGNVDHWNIDEVYLATKYQNRSYADTTQNDLAFVYEAPTMLSQYSAEPWEQYQPSDLRTTPMPMFERNNNASWGGGAHPNNIINGTYNYEINTPVTTTYTGGAINIYPFVDTAYNQFAPQSQPPLDTTNFPASLANGTVFTITHYYNLPINDFDPWNDTVRFNQVFYNYYAYDDGTPEAAYFISPVNTSGIGTFVPVDLAYQFTLNKPDSIFGVSIYFDYVFVNNSSYTFIITVWNDNGGHPGSMIYQDTVVNPFYDTVGNDEFSTYYFSGAPLLPKGNFYIGWQQTSGDSMNIGYDWNSNHYDRLFYYNWSAQSWQQSIFSGTLMVRPLIGNASQYVGINELKVENGKWKIFPNPNNGIFTIQMENGELKIENDKTQVEIYNMLGQEIYSNTFSIFNSQFSINISNQPPGLYFLRIVEENGITISKKFIIAK